MTEKKQGAPAILSKYQLLCKESTSYLLEIC